MAATLTTGEDRAWIVPLFCVALILNMVGFANIAVVLPAVARDLSLDPSQAGLLGGTFFAAYAIGVPLFVPLTDRFPPLAVYVVGSLAWIAGGVCIAVADHGIVLPFVGRLLSGIGMAATYMPGMILLVSRVPDTRRSVAASTYTSCITLGTAFCFAVTGLTAIYLPWRLVFLVAAGAAALALPLVIFAASRPTTNASQQANAVSPPRKLSFLVRPRMLAWLAAFAGNSWEGMAMRTWWISYLVFCGGGQADGSVLAKLAVATACAGFFAMPVSVAVARRAQRGRRVSIVAGICVASGLFALLPPLLAGLPLIVSIIATTIYMCLIFADAGTLPAAILDEIPAEQRGTGLAAAATVANLGAFLGVTAAGAVLNVAGGASSGTAWLFAFATIGAGSVAGGVVLRLTMNWADRREY